MPFPHFARDVEIRPFEHRLSTNRRSAVLGVVAELKKVGLGCAGGKKRDWSQSWSWTSDEYSQNRTRLGTSVQKLDLILESGERDSNPRLQLWEIRARVRSRPL